MTIYRRWGTVGALVLQAAVRDVSRRLPVTPTGNLRADLIGWAQRAEESIQTSAGRRLAAAAARVAARDGPEAAYVDTSLRIAEIQALIDAAQPPRPLRAERVLDRVLAPLYLRQMFGYAASAGTPAELVAQMLDEG